MSMHIPHLAFVMTNPTYFESSRCESSETGNVDMSHVPCSPVLTSSLFYGVHLANQLVCCLHQVLHITFDAGVEMM